VQGKGPLTTYLLDSDAEDSHRPCLRSSHSTSDLLRAHTPSPAVGAAVALDTAHARLRPISDSTTVVVLMNEPSNERKEPMTINRKAWIAIGVLALVAAIAVIALVASGGGSAGGAY